MSSKIAIAIVHGIGKQDKDFSKELQKNIEEQFVHLGGAQIAQDLIFAPVFWGPVLQKPETKLWKKLKTAGILDYIPLRQFLVDFAADAIAYQPVAGERHIYDAIHRILAKTLHRLSQKTGSAAPLCVIAHSLGTVIASNFFYDLQQHFEKKRKIIPALILKEIKNSPLEQGKTLSLFYTLGSPLALWSLRFPDFGVPLDIPAPGLTQTLPQLKGEWINVYDRDDMIGFPLKNLNRAYHRAVTEDLEINVGGILTRWNPAAHAEYWTDQDVAKKIAQGLFRMWYRLQKGR